MKKNISIGGRRSTKWVVKTVAAVTLATALTVGVAGVAEARPRPIGDCVNLRAVASLDWAIFLNYQYLARLDADAGLTHSAYGDAASIWHGVWHNAVGDMHDAGC